MAVKVLIVEDNPVARSFLCRVVRESFSDTHRPSPKPATWKTHAARSA